MAAGKRAPLISPLALEAVNRGDALFDIERTINGESAERRLAVRRERCVPLVAEFEDWMRTERAKLSRHAAVAKVMDYMLNRWDGFARFLGDGRICLTNKAAERALRPLCLGRKSGLFAGSDRGGERRQRSGSHRSARPATTTSPVRGASSPASRGPCCPPPWRPQPQPLPACRVPFEAGIAGIGRAPRELLDPVRARDRSFSAPFATVRV